MILLLFLFYRMKLISLIFLLASDIMIDMGHEVVPLANFIFVVDHSAETGPFAREFKDWELGPDYPLLAFDKHRNPLVLKPVFRMKGSDFQQRSHFSHATQYGQLVASKLEDMEAVRKDRLNEGCNKYSPEYIELMEEVLKFSSRQVFHLRMSLAVPSRTECFMDHIDYFEHYCMRLIREELHQKHCETPISCGKKHLERIVHCLKDQRDFLLQSVVPPPKHYT